MAGGRPVKDGEPRRKIDVVDVVLLRLISLCLYVLIGGG